MTNPTLRYLTVIWLTLVGVILQQFTAMAQERLRVERDGGSTLALQFGGRGETSDTPAPSAEPRDLVALTVWVLTVSDSATPETDELIGQLVDKANSLPVVIGKSDDVRDLVKRLKVAGLLSTSREYRLLTLDGQQVTSQAGSNHPTIVATNITNRGRTNSINFQQVGTMITATARIDAASGILVSLDYQASGVEKSRDVAIDQPGEGQPTFADIMATQQINTTVRLKSGTALLVRSDATQDFGEKSTGGQTRLIILSATVIPALEEPRSAAAE